MTEKFQNTKASEAKYLVILHLLFKLRSLKERSTDQPQKLFNEFVYLAN